MTYDEWMRIYEHYQGKPCVGGPPPPWSWGPESDACEHVRNGELGYCWGPKCGACYFGENWTKPLYYDNKSKNV